MKELTGSFAWLRSSLKSGSRRCENIVEPISILKKIVKGESHTAAIDLNLKFPHPDEWLQPRSL